MPFVRAVYDNVAEAEDELSFRRGDVLALLEIDADGIEGWWRCALADVIGLAPANRLKLITETKCPVVALMASSFQAQGSVSAMTDYDVPQSITPDTERSLASLTLEPPRVTSNSFSDRDSDYDTPSSLTPDLDSAPQDGHLWKTNKSSVMTKLFKRNRRPHEHETYDVPSPSKREKEKQSSSFEKSNKLGKLKRNEKSGGNDGGRLRQKSRNVSEDRDSCMADYDVPSSRETVPSMKLGTSPSRSEEGLSDRESTDYDIPHIGSHKPFTDSQKQLVSTNAKSQIVSADLKQSRNEGLPPLSQSVKERSTSPANTSGLKREDLTTAFKSTQKETRISFQKIIDDAGKWRDCKNVVTRASIARLSCVTAWKALQDTINCVSKIVARNQQGNQMSSHLQKMRQESDVLEGVIEYLTAAAKPADALEKSKYDYLTILVELSSYVQRLLQQLETVFNGEKEGIYPESNAYRQSDIIITVSLPDEDAGKSQYPNNDYLRSRPLPKTPKPGQMIKSASSSNILDIGPKSPKLTSTAVTSSMKLGASECRQPIRRSMDSILTDPEDYDTPRATAAGVGTKMLDSRMREDRDLTPQLRWNAASEAFETKRGKRGAIVMDKGDKQFDILLRRHSDSKVSPFKMVAGSVVPGGDAMNAGGVEREESDDAVDYDYPMPVAEDKAQIHVPLSDKQLLKFYARSVLDETKTLKMCHLDILSLNEPNDCSASKNNIQTFIFLSKTILVSAHKLSFIGDTLLRNLIQNEIRKRILLRCKELGRGNDLMTVITSTKTAAVGGEKAVLARHRLMESSRNVLEAALKFAEIVVRSR